MCCPPRDASMRGMWGAEGGCRICTASAVQCETTPKLSLLHGESRARDPHQETTSRSRSMEVHMWEGSPQRAVPAPTHHRRRDSMGRHERRCHPRRPPLSETEGDQLTKDRLLQLHMYPSFVHGKQSCMCTLLEVARVVKPCSVGQW